MWTPSVVYLLTRFWSSRRSRERKHVLDSKTVLLFFIFAPRPISILSVSFKRLHLVYLDCFPSSPVVSLEQSLVTDDENESKVNLCIFLPFILAVKSQPFNICAIFGKRQRMQLLFLEIHVVYSSAFFVRKEMTSLLDFLSASRALLSTRIPSSSLNLHKYWKAMVVYLWWSHCECLCFL